MSFLCANGPAFRYWRILLVPWTQRKFHWSWHQHLFKMMSSFIISTACHRYFRRVIGVSSACHRCFFTQVRLFVLILQYNCFTHELQMPEVRLFFKKMIFFDFELCRRIKIGATSLNFHTIGPCTWASSTCTQRAISGQLAVRSASLGPGFWGTGTG